MDITEKYYSVGDVQLHVIEAGDPQGDILLFLHGFPEFWWGWRHQISFFAQKGYRVVVPDQRGYNLSSKPAGKRSYRLALLCQDIAGLIQQLTPKPVRLVGHDWGGAVAWHLAMEFPHLLAQLVIINIPHPRVMQNLIKHSFKQKLKSWYMLFFQLPVLPESMLQMFRFKLLMQSMRNSALPGTFTRQDFAQYRHAWMQKGALTGMLNWYRAIPLNMGYNNKPINTPTLMLWGKQDRFLSEEMAHSSIAKCTSGQLVLVPEASHWIQHEQPGLVNQKILEFIRNN